MQLGILKVDCLSLGMLSAIRKCFDLVEQHHATRLSLATIPDGDMATYDMICAADTTGVFQIESRAQMSMLPRLKPRCFYDLVIEVAIVRPGPIQGNMVHPYLQARKNPQALTYPNEALREVLHKTLGPFEPACEYAQHIARVSLREIDPRVQATDGKVRHQPPVVEALVGEG